MITQSPVLPGQQNPALFLPCPTWPSAFSSHPVESLSSPLDEHKFQVWMECPVDTIVVKCSVPQKCIQVGLLLPHQNHLILWQTQHSATFIMADCTSVTHMPSCSSLALRKAWWLVSVSKQLSSKSVTIYSSKVNSTRGQRDIHFEFSNDKIFWLYNKHNNFFINKNDIIVFLKLMKHHLFYF